LIKFTENEENTLVELMADKAHVYLHQEHIGIFSLFIECEGQKKEIKLISNTAITALDMDN